MKRYYFITIFTVASIAINYFCSYLAGLIAFPLYLDSIMTIAVSALCGLVPGILCAVASNFLLYICKYRDSFYIVSYFNSCGREPYIPCRTQKMRSKCFPIAREFRQCKTNGFFLFNRKFYVDWLYRRHHKFCSW